MRKFWKERHNLRKANKLHKRANYKSSSFQNKVNEREGGGFGERKKERKRKPLTVGHHTTSNGR